MRLKDMQTGDSGRILGFDPAFRPHRHKLLAMGLTPGADFKIVRIAPLGDPVEIRIRGADLSLRRDEVAGLRVERLANESTGARRTTPEPAFTIALIGNPNCGKTTLFNGLTGARQHVGNWAGVTVEKKSGAYRYAGKRINVVDLPGIYALDVGEKASSLDEQIARDYILAQQADLIVNIVDTSHLEHNLYLTLQLLEMRLPLLVVLNNMDDASGRNLLIDSDEIARRLDCPLESLIATRSAQVQALKSTIDGLVAQNILAHTVVDYPPKIAQALDHLTPQIEQQSGKPVGDARWLATKLLERDGYALTHAAPSVLATAEQLRREIEDQSGEEADILIADSRYAYINRLVSETLTSSAALGRSLSDKIDSIILHRFLAIPIFFAVIYLLFTLTIKLGRAFKPFFNDLAQALFVDGVGHFLTLLDSPSWLIVLLSSGVGNGVREVAAFVPILGFLYLFISLLEESGYMARATFALDRLMRVLGLPGKAFVPMILGFGCNVPAMMATRTLERPRDRLLTILLNPLMTCGARLAVFTLFAAAFFPDNAELIVFTLYLIGVGFAVLTALLLKHTFLHQEFSLVLMEIPSYHIPKLKNVWLNSWTRVRAFVVRVGKIIVTMVVILNLLASIGTDGSFKTNNIEHSLLSAAGRAVTPALAPLGVEQDNWPATVALLTGVLHKVVVISTLKTIYAETDARKAVDGAQAFDLGASVIAAFNTIPQGLKKMFGLAGMQQTSGPSPFTAALHRHFHGQIGAFAYLLFVLLYFPCIATTAAAYKESGRGWALFMVVWASALAYLSATLFYQLATYTQHPASSTAWLAGIALTASGIVLSFRHWGKRRTVAD
ncbi:Fe(2+) transporter permease subunit FeoB [Methylomarinum sp. Ch1-1]|uniref:Ferrous iron transport protein B n=1 Tax=Methylomarinum roseum TaxID=3067653 RepID=A0AAU7NRL5_9GAMM|nr:Fe(2+) transporter permease subunit FeoB [Methylomarinum sp. Ch1-1]MDP4520422.1 Fe(2+) transporter permease subunit FeoB [Methylomarinum sp. Ch1-1]